MDAFLKKWPWRKAFDTLFMEQLSLIDNYAVNQLFNYTEDTMIVNFWLLEKIFNYQLSYVHGN